MDTGYVAGSAAVSSVSPGATTSDVGYWSLSKCKKAYLDYLGNKVNEIEEQKDARRYYHASQWTDKQIRALKARKQPVVTFNRIGRKIDGVVGLLERLRQDPKAYPRTPQHEEGAELATAVVRYVLDEQDWKSKSPECARDGAIDGIAGIELEIIDGDQGDKEVGFEIVEPDSFFYDPRSYRMDFSDARYMGMGKWIDIDTAVDLFPDKEDEIRQSCETGTDLTTNSDRDNKWFSVTGETNKKIRLVDIWYQVKGKWLYTIFTGATKLMEGESYLFDEKNKTMCKYIMFSGNIDHDGDRYGFVRNMKSAQDEYNTRRSKGLHILNSKRLILSQGSVQDVEEVRREWNRPDGVVVVQGAVNEGAKADDQSFDFAGQLKMMENAIAELENYGPNQALIGDVQNQSGRAISLLQQAGMAELGPYIMAYRGWKVRVYRAIWNAVQRHWTGERWIRVTDDENVKQFIQINGVQVDPQTGLPSLVNAIGSLDVDIIMDEGADAINMQADAYDTLTVMASKGAQIPPQVLLELAPLPASTKKKLMDMMSKPDPAQEQAKQTALAAEQAKVEETVSKTALNYAKAQETQQPQQGAPQKPEKYELPPEIQNAKALAEIDHKDAQAYHIRTQADLAPIQLMHESAHKTADREQRDEHFQPASAE